MGKIWQKDSLYNSTRKYVRWCTRACFSSVKIEGMENIPQDCMVILAPNHCVALMDPLMILLLPKNEIVFGARSDIFHNPMVAKILTFLRIVPIARERNGASEVAKNLDTFETIVDVLDNNGDFCLYAEGTHNPERGLLPIKKGIFRIAKMAQEQTGKKICMVPVAVDYEYFFSQMGRVRMKILKPLDVGAFFEERKDTQVEAKTYRELCDWLTGELTGNLGYDWEGNRRCKSMSKAAKVALGILGLPLFIACGAMSLPIWLPSMLILKGMEDKAWSHTVYFVLRFFFPLLWPFDYVFERMKNFYGNPR